MFHSILAYLTSHYQWLSVPFHVSRLSLLYSTTSQSVEMPDNMHSGHTRSNFDRLQYPQPPAVTGYLINHAYPSQSWTVSQVTGGGDKPTLHECILSDIQRIDKCIPTHQEVEEGQDPEENLQHIAKVSQNPFYTPPPCPLMSSILI